MKIHPEIFAFAPIRRKTVRPEAAVRWLQENGIEDVAGENSLDVRMEGEEAIINIDASIGKSWWDDSGITAKEFRDALEQIPAGKKITVRINSEGGSVKEGLDIYDTIESRSADITCRITGYALSIASVLPLAAGRIISPNNAIWMIHKAWMNASGNEDDFLKNSKMLGTHDKTMAALYKKKSGTASDIWLDRMRAETWLTGKEAVDLGLADEGEDDGGVDAGAKRPICAEYLARCKNIPATIFNALSAPSQGAAHPETNPKAGQKPAQRQDNTMNKKILAALLFEHGVKNQTTGKDFTETDADADFETGLKALAKKPGLNEDARIQALESRMALAEERRLKDRVLSYVEAGKITNDEVKIYIDAAKQDEAGTFAILDKKEAASLGGSPIGYYAGINVFEGDADPNAREGLTGLCGPRSEMLANIHKEHKTPQARHQVIKDNYSKLLRQALEKDGKTGRREAFGANTYSGTLVTNFLMDGSITDLVNVWAMFNAFSLAKDVDPYKPLATGQLKHVTGAETTQTNPTNFEPATGSTVAPITVTTNWYNQPMRVGPTDLNNGLRIEDLRQKNLAAFADVVTQAATAPITAANFTATPLIVSAAAFGLSDMATLQGQLQKSPIKNLILDGTYKARVANQPGYFQKTGEGISSTDGWKPYGWDGVYLASNWSGAGNNIKGLACAPQAMVRATGLPLNPPNIPGGVFNTSTFEIPGCSVACALSVWFSLASRTLFTSWDIIAGFAAADLTAGVVIANGTPT